MKKENPISYNKFNFFKWINVHFLLVSISLTIAISFRLKDISRDIVMQDEATSLIFFILPPLKSYAFTDYFMPNNHIFHSILSNLSIQLFGNNELAFRFPALISGILAVGLIYWWVLLIYKSKEIAFLSSLFLALSPIHIAYSQTARGYSLIIFFSLLSLLSFYKILENLKKGWVVVFIISNILNVITIPSSLFFVVSQYISLTIIYVVFKSNLYKFDSETRQYVEKISIKRIMCFFFIIFLPILLLYVPLLDQMQAQAAKEGHHLLKDILPPLFKGNLLLGLPKSMLLIFFYGCWCLYIKSKFWGSFLFLLFVLPFFSAVIGVGGPPRVYLFCLPFFILSLMVGLYETIKMILNILSNRIKISLQTKKIATLTSILLIFIPIIIFLEKNYYPQYNSFKYKKLKSYISKFDHINNLIFKPGGLEFDYYLDNLIERNALGILYSGNINNIYLIKPSIVGLKKLNLENYVYNLGRGNYLLLNEFKDLNLKAKYDFDILRGGEKPLSYRLYRLQPSNVKKIINNNFMKTEWIQLEGRRKVKARYHSLLNQIEIEIDQEVSSSLPNDSLIYANPSLKLKVAKKGFVFIIYAITYPNISKYLLFEPLTPSILTRGEKTKAFIHQPKFSMDRTVSGFDFYGNRLWYIMQKIVPMEKGDYDLTLGFWVRGLLDGAGTGKHKYLVRNLQAYLVEF